MDYEKAYKEALKFFKHLYPNIGGELKEQIENLFAELKESEDERIRGELVHYFKTYYEDISPDFYITTGISIKAAIAWLEKQNHVEWSEEDEDMLAHCIGAIHIAGHNVGNTYTPKDKEEMKKWLKSLKQRIGGENDTT